MSSSIAATADSTITLTRTCREIDPTRAPTHLQDGFQSCPWLATPTTRHRRTLRSRASARQATLVSPRNGQTRNVKFGRRSNHRIAKRRSQSFSAHNRGLEYRNGEPHLGWASVRLRANQHPKDTESQAKLRSRHDLLQRCLGSSGNTPTDDIGNPLWCTVLH